MPEQLILIVDDDADIRDSLASVIPLLVPGVRVTTADGPRQVLQRLRAGERFDLILSDQRMPHMSGLELLAAIQPYAATTPFVLFTSHPQDLVRVQPEVAAHVAAVVEKGTDVKHLAQALTSCLDPDAVTV